MERANNYMKNIRLACGTKLAETNGVYSGKEGHLRLARECGYALNDFTEKERREILTSSYSNIYVIACNLKPLLDAKEWIEELTKGYKKSLDYKNYNGKKLYNQIKSLADMDAYYDKIKLDFEELQLTEEEAIEMLDEIITDYNIRNIVDFRSEMEKLDSQIPY